MTSSRSISVKDVSFGYHSSELLFSHFSLHIQPGEFVSFVGRSGSGKSTLLKMIIGLLPSNGIEVSVEPGKLAYIPQKSLLYPWRTSLQNATIGLEASRTPIEPETVRWVRDLFNKYAIGGLEDRLPSTLSGGQEQRVSIVRALTTDPDVLVCDEPFSNIDYVTKLDIHVTFRSWTVTRPTTPTVVVVTHNIDEALFLSDRVVVLGGAYGEPRAIVDEVRTDELLRQRDTMATMTRSPVYHRLYTRILSAIGASH